MNAADNEWRYLIWRKFRSQIDVVKIWLKCLEMLISSSHLKAINVMPLRRLTCRETIIVPISAGINDIKFNQASPVTLHSFIRDSVAQYPTTQFLFDAISPLSINADRYNQMNARIDHVNELILKLSIRTSNIKLFDNVSINLSHLARDGLHLNETGKRL